jgi:hypothetical protein
MPQERQLRTKVSRWMMLEMLAGRMWYAKLSGSPWVGRVGIPDYVFCRNGRFGAVELKQPGLEESGLSPAQRLEIERIHLSLGQVLVASSLEPVQEFVRSFDV